MKQSAPKQNASSFALVDCNNFYVSCERVFDPSLARVPVAVRSNNDGCIIARSNEVKAMGVPMGAPYFQYKKLLARHGTRIFSSNYALYGDMSSRVMAVLGQCAPDVEVYSIDEAFLHLAGNGQAEGQAREARQRVLQWTGIPTSIGIAPTKTLAKIANRFAKKHPEWEGVFDMTQRKDVDDLLHIVTVEDVWGIGTQRRKLLNKHGIHTARELRDANEKWIQQRLTITGLRTVYELRGISCLPLEEVPTPKKGITSSRSFGEPVTDLGPLSEAVSSYVTRAAEKLRGQVSICGMLTVFITTKDFGKGPHYTNSRTATLPEPTAYTPLLIRYAEACLEKIYRPGYRYRKAGVMLTAIQPKGSTQAHLFESADHSVNGALMEVVDEINGRWGRGTVFFAASGTKQAWAMKQVQRSPRYTTRWEEVPDAHA
ncbi:MAG TPA: Y-family DNA polymerase [Rhodothermales bacterium]|nr:Y-family DNA polymerase [Rhodothermales bacterium]